MQQKLFELSLSEYLNGILIGIMVAAPVGAVAIMCIQRTINRGFLPGLFIGIGSALGDFFYAIIAGFGISFIADFLTENRMILGILGGILMMAFGYKIFKTNTVKQMREQQSPKYKNKFFNDFAASFALTISNPLTVIMFGGLFGISGAVAKDSSFYSTVLTLSGVITGAVAWWTTLVSTVNIFRKKIKLRYIFWINKITGICIFIFGISVIVAVTFFKDKL